MIERGRHSGGMRLLVFAAAGSLPLLLTAGVAYAQPSGPYKEQPVDSVQCRISYANP